MPVKYNSYALVFYMVTAFSYYFVGTALRGVFFFTLVILSVLLFVSQNLKDARGLFVERRVVNFLVVFFVVLIIQLINNTLTPFVLYIVAAPCLAIFILKNKFNTRILKIPVFIMASVFSVYYILHKTLEGAFSEMSVNYVSVVLIMNAILINSIERLQKERISLLPSFIALFFSLLAMGRSGILCTFLLFTSVLIINWKFFSVKKKTAFAIFILVPILIFALLKFDIISSYIDNLAVLERFNERGVDSPSRDILKREYLNNMTFANILLGFNFSNNIWFIHYGLNPHNSYIRLHFYFGIVFLLVLGFILQNGWKLLKKDFFLAILVFIILLRSWTDSALFLTLYDFVLLILLFIPNYKKAVNYD